MRPLWAHSPLRGAGVELAKNVKPHRRGAALFPPREVKVDNQDDWPPEHGGKNESPPCQRPSTENHE